MARSNWYAYKLSDGKSGVVDSWAACERSVKGKPNARYRGFLTRQEAESWLGAGARYDGAQTKLALKSKLLPGVYFDAGTGRGEGVEVSVTDEKGRDLLELVLPKKKINRFGKLHLGEAVTNNYGELLGCSFALDIAEKLKVKKIFGDSRLVLKYWSKGIIKKKDLPPATVELSMEVARKREKFETHGGTLSYVSGSVNPADLGFH